MDHLINDSDGLKCTALLALLAAAADEPDEAYETLAMDASAAPRRRRELRKGSQLGETTVPVQQFWELPVFQGGFGVVRRTMKKRKSLVENYPPKPLDAMALGVTTPLEQTPCLHRRRTSYVPRCGEIEPIVPRKVSF